MGDSTITTCPHCGQHITASPPTGTCPACSHPLAPSQDELRSRITRLARQHRGAGERLGLLQQEYGDLRQQLDRLAETRQAEQAQLGRQTARLEEQSGERLQWEVALEEERRLREQAEAAAAELRILRAQDLEQHEEELRDRAMDPDEREQLRQLAEAAYPLEARIQELEQENRSVRATLKEAERSLVDAAEMVGQVAGLRVELERLGTRYLHAREETARLLNEKLDLRAEMEDLARQLREKATREQPYPLAEVDRARERIREALRRQHGSPPPAHE